MFQGETDAEAREEDTGGVKTYIYSLTITEPSWGLCAAQGHRTDLIGPDAMRGGHDATEVGSQPGPTSL